MKKSDANRYVVDLFDTFSIERNQLLGKEWRNTLAEYDTEIVKAGWGQIVGECRLRWLPPLKTVHLILGSIKRRPRPQPRIENHLTKEDRIMQSRFLKLVLSTMKDLKRGRITKRQMYKLHAEFFMEAGMEGSAEAILRASAEDDIKD